MRATNSHRIEAGRLAAFVIAALTVLAVAVPGSQAGAETPSEAHQANIKGMAREDPEHSASLLYAYMVIDKVRALNPLVVTVNEVCKNQYYEMVDELGPEGWTGRWNIQIKTGVMGDWGGRSAQADKCGNEFGNAVFTKHYRGAGNTYTHSYQDQRSGDGTVRGYACVRGEVYLRRWTVCATHLTNTPKDSTTAEINAIRNVRRAQDDELRLHLYNWGANSYRMGGGDFNDAPGFFWPWEGSYDEGDQNRNYNTTVRDECGDGSAGGKLDYFWFRTGDGLTTTGNASRYLMCSDHLYYQARFYFND